MKPNAALPKPFAAALLLLGAGALLAGCDPKPTPTAQPPASASSPDPSHAPPPKAAPEPADLGRQIVGQAFSVLSSNLMTAIAKGGPSNALEFCSVNVAPIVATVANARGVELRRVTHKPRNPDNQASPAELALIESYRARLATTTNLPPQIVTNASGRTQFVAPILLGNPLCLQCHGQPGTEIAPGTLSVIDRLYPADAARGFKLGELRGLWVVTLPTP